MLPRSKKILALPNDICKAAGIRAFRGESEINPVNIGAPPTGVLLSGGSGLIGHAVKQMLFARRTSVLQLVRHSPFGTGQLKWDPVAAPIVADESALEGLQAAIHLSGASVVGRRWTPAYKRTMWMSRVQSTRALASTLSRLREPPRVLVVASAVGIYGDRGDEILNESSSPGAGFLADVCKDWEAAAQLAQDAGIRVVHTRFGVVLGPGGGALSRMLPVFRLGLGGRLGSGRQWMSWVSLQDAAAAILLSMDSPGIAGAVNVTAPAPVTNADFTKALARAVHRPAILHAPAFALRIALGEMSDEALLASARVIPSKLTAAGFKFAHPTVEEALNSAI